jgi:hypothetical protein
MEFWLAVIGGAFLIDRLARLGGWLAGRILRRGMRALPPAKGR